MQVLQGYIDASVVLYLLEVLEGLLEVVLCIFELLVFCGHHFVERENGELWLCADRSQGPALKLGSCGLQLSMRQPFCDDERADGACRAAARIVRLSRGMI